MPWSDFFFSSEKSLWLHYAERLKKGIIGDKKVTSVFQARGDGAHARINI